MQADDFPSRFMKRIKITHKTVYHYRTPVTFGPHRALIRPREGHDVHIASSLLEIEPKANVCWLWKFHRHFHFRRARTETESP
jgi:transglutaminase-like putative cysteine protease